MGDLEVVERWQAAVNDADVGALERLSTDDVELVGPRGTTTGREHLGEWVGRARARLDDRRWWCGGDGAVLVEHDATWHDAQGAPIGNQVIWSAFEVREARVSRFARYDAQESAFRATGIGARDEVSREGAR